MSSCNRKEKHFVRERKQFQLYSLAMKRKYWYAMKWNRWIAFASEELALWLVLALALLSRTKNWLPAPLGRAWRLSAHTTVKTCEKNCNSANKWKIQDTGFVATQVVRTRLRCRSETAQVSIWSISSEFTKGAQTPTSLIRETLWMLWAIDLHFLLFNRVSVKSSTTFQGDKVDKLSSKSRPHSGQKSFNQFQFSASPYLNPQHFRLPSYECQRAGVGTK